MSEKLEVELIYLYPKENANIHKTHMYELIHDEENPVPILRRGLIFSVAVRFCGRAFDKTKDNVKLLFNYGPQPNPIKGTQGILKIDEDKMKRIDMDNYNWNCNVLDNSNETLSLEVCAPPTIPIGLWFLKVETNILNSTETPLSFDYENDLYFICNPWNCHDLAFMPEEKLLGEYVLNDIGKIWVGPFGSSKGREWVFGQFDGIVLPAIVIMMEKSGMAYESRGDIIKLSRMISKMVNSNDDDGILVGRWDGEYDDGTAPAAWTGSVPILQQYLDTEAPVSYGQCWVFSGVVTTICRALGIPSRVVSNLVSAHDANCSLTVDKYYDKNNEEINYDPNNDKGADSIWNYHVWNDVHMARPDLPPGYGGWQALDATPQETSGSFYQCGPASLEAIKRGQVGLNYDVPFMVSSVNADLMKWKEDKTSELGYSKIYCNKYHIGRFIYTKKPFVYDSVGDTDRMDITKLYKETENTERERMALLNAVRGTETAKRFFDIKEDTMKDIEFDLEELEKIKIGENFSVVVKVKNNSDHLRTIQAVLSAGSVYYTGVKATTIMKAQEEFKMNPHSNEQLKMTVKADNYLEKLVEYCNMKIYAICTVKETNQTWADEDDFQVLKPNIEIKTPQKTLLKKWTPITLSFVNPLKKTLTNCKFNLSGSAFIRNQVLPFPNVKPGSLVKTEALILPKFDGEQTVVATFISKELHDVTGSAKVVVVKE